MRISCEKTQSRCNPADYSRSCRDYSTQRQFPSLQSSASNSSGPSTRKQGSQSDRSQNSQNWDTMKGFAHAQELDAENILVEKAFAEQMMAYVDPRLPRTRRGRTSLQSSHATVQARTQQGSSRILAYSMLTWWARPDSNRGPSGVSCSGL